MVDEKKDLRNRVCHLCGKKCYGRTCKECYSKEKYRGIYRVERRSERKRRVKNE